MLCYAGVDLLPGARVTTWSPIAEALAWHDLVHGLRYSWRA